eukprot:6178-Heterococcus_DN1.PRE.2
MHANCSASVAYHGGSGDSGGCYICGGYTKWFTHVEAVIGQFFISTAELLIHYQYAQLALTWCGSLGAVYCGAVLCVMSRMSTTPLYRVELASSPLGVFALNAHLCTRNCYYVKFVHILSSLAFCRKMLLCYCARTVKLECVRNNSKALMSNKASIRIKDFVSLCAYYYKLSTPLPTQHYTMIYYPPYICKEVRKELNARRWTRRYARRYAMLAISSTTTTIACYGAHCEDTTAATTAAYYVVHSTRFTPSICNELTLRSTDDTAPTVTT